LFQLERQKLSGRSYCSKANLVFVKRTQSIDKLLRAYSSYISDLDSTRYERICYYVRHVQETNILSMMFYMFDERTSQTIMFAMLNERTRQTIYIFLIYRN